MTLIGGVCVDKGKSKALIFIIGRLGKLRLDKGSATFAGLAAGNNKMWVFRLHLSYLLFVERKSDH
jgi:hypothetical protein